jgi:penicillin-binding protein 2
MASYPNYDNNAFARGISQAEYDKLLADPAKPLYDRALAGEYAPGSTFKMVTGSAGLEDGKISPSTLLGCPSHLSFGSWTYWNWAKYDFGAMSVARALNTSCDTFFYQVAERVGPDSLARFARAYGYGAVPGIEIPGARAGVVPSPAYKQAICATPGLPDCGWNAGDTVTMGIGQSYVLTTPLIQAMYAATLANGGVLMRPTLVHAVTDGAGKTLRVAEPEPIGELPLSASNLETLRAAMGQSLTGPWGTAAIARYLGFKWDGGCKTGTAQYAGSGIDLPAHAWFVDFAPYNRPSFASATLLENGSSGEHYAEPPAIRVLNYYMQHRSEINATDG